LSYVSYLIPFSKWVALTTYIIVLSVTMVFCENFGKLLWMILYELTSTNCYNQSKGLRRCVPRRKPMSHISCSRECGRVWENEPSHSQLNSHFGNWSFDGLLNLQRAIAGVKTHWIEEFFISLKNSWNLYVWNGLAWPIWTLKT
jgi:hypothetical protein